MEGGVPEGHSSFTAGYNRDMGEPATREDLAQAKAELLEAVHDVETRLLKAFYGFAESNQQRQAALETNILALIKRVSTIEERLLEIERRLNLPPAA